MQRAQLTIGDLEEMAKNSILLVYAASDYYKKFKEPEFDENGKLKYDLIYS